MSDVIDVIKAPFCETPKEIIQSGEGKGRETTKKVLSKVLEQKKVSYLEDIFDKKLKNEQLDSTEVGFLNGILGDKGVIESLNKHVSAIVWIIEKRAGDMKDFDIKKFPLYNDAGEVDVTKMITWLLGDQKTDFSETFSSDTFCGISLDKLTDNQKILFNKLNPAERKKLSETVLHNEAGGQFEFANTARGKLAIQDKDSATDVNKSSANVIAKQAGNGWKLPEDVDYRTEKFYDGRLYPEFSDLDAMIAQMPGDSDGQKVENFRLLTGMFSWYWTGTFYDKSGSHSVIRGFFNNGRGRDINNHNYNNHVRLVRSLEA